MNATSLQTASNTAETQLVAAAGVDFAYRGFGRAFGLPPVLLQHFRGNLDNWDPALVDALAAAREVILVDYPGVGCSTGEPNSTIASTARQMIAFIAALGLDRVDLHGFSIGGLVAQEIATAARGESKPENLLHIMLAHTETSQAKGVDVLGRVLERQDGRDPAEVVADIEAFLANDHGKARS